MLGNSNYFYATMYKGPAQAVAALFSHRFAEYLIFLILTGGSAAIFRTPYVLLVIPSVTISALLDDRFTLVQLHYIVEPAFWIFFAGLTAFIDEKETKRLKIIRAAALCATMLLLTAFQRHGLPLYSHHPHAESYKKALSLIPENATIALGAPLPDRLWKAQRVTYVIYEPDSCRRAQWAVFQKAGKPAWCTPSEFIRVRNFTDTLASSGFQLAWEDSVMVVFTATTGINAKHE